MKWHRNDEIDAQLSEAGFMVLGPEPADALADHLAAAMLHCKYNVPQRGVVGAEPKDRFECVALITATRTSFRNVFVLADCGGAAWAREVGVSRQCDSAVSTKILSGIGNEVTTPGADGRVDQLSQSARDLEKHVGQVKVSVEL